MAIKLTPGPTEFLAHLNDDGRHQPLVEHLLAVSNLAETHAGKIGLADVGALIGLLHDLGKYSSAFQAYLRTQLSAEERDDGLAERGTIDHSSAGAQKIWQDLKARGARDRAIGEILALCIASHHSGLIDCIEPSGKNNLLRRLEKPDEKTHLSEVLARVDSVLRDKYSRLLNNKDFGGGVHEIIRQICQAAHNETLRRFGVGLLVRYLFSCLIDADRTDTADSETRSRAKLRLRGKYSPWNVLCDRLERTLGGFRIESDIDRLRRSVSEQSRQAASRPKGIFTLTVPTGGGKTLASLRFALHHANRWGLQRVVYVSPYTSIIDQNARIVRAVLEGEGDAFGSVVLEHHSNLTPSQETQRSKLLTENWDAPVVFTTAVQFLDSIFGGGTRAARRMHALANAVIVFDEVQTLPIRCVHLFNNAVSFLTRTCGSTCVLCTATQPLLHRVDHNKGAIALGDESEIISDVAGTFAALRRHVVFDRRKAGGWTDKDVSQLAHDEAANAGNCLVVVNTKRQARSVHAGCMHLGGIPVLHLSTHMCPAHRLTTLESIKRRLDGSQPVICVSTQLIEAGVDISFRAAIRALAGLDSIAQVAGRCNRHQEVAVGNIHIVNFHDERSELPFDIRIAQESAQRVLDENATGGPDRTVDLSDPKLIESYFQYHFFDRRNDMDYPVGPKQAEREDTLLNMLAQNRLARSSSPGVVETYLRQAFMTASRSFETIESDTQGLVVPYSMSGKRVIADLSAVPTPEKCYSLLRLAQQFTVNVFPNVLKRLRSRNAVYELQEGTGILALRESFYSEEFGLSEEGKERLEAQFA